MRKSEGLGIFVGARTLEVVDANTQVVAQQWKASGLLGGYATFLQALISPQGIKQILILNYLIKKT